MMQAEGRKKKHVPLGLRALPRQHFVSEAGPSNGKVHSLLLSFLLSGFAPSPAA
jgi:hypothetical protein